MFASSARIMLNCDSNLHTACVVIDDNSPESLNLSSGFRANYHRITKQAVRAYMGRLHLPLQRQSHTFYLSPDVGIDIS